MDRIYMDNAATTAVSPEVLQTMLPYFSEIYGNPSSIHSTGRDARRAVDAARKQVAQAIGAQPTEIYFTAGGSESDNWAIKGTAFAKRDKGNHIITTAIEHHAVLHTCQWLEKQGFQVTYLPVDEHGLVSVEDFKAAMRPDTILASIMFANNEIGTIEPVAELGRIARAHKVLFHTDAVQAVGHVPIDVQAMHIDLLSLSGHKFWRPERCGSPVRQNRRVAHQPAGGRRAGAGKAGRNRKCTRHCRHGCRAYGGLPEHAGDCLPGDRASGSADCRSEPDSPDHRQRRHGAPPARECKRLLPGN